MKTEKNDKKKTEETFVCAVCGRTKAVEEANYNNCIGKVVCDDCQEDYYRY